jgi:hypothetical protein
LPGTITFNPQVGTPYSLSIISSFILSKYTLKGNDVTQYLNFLIGSNVLIYKADDINTFGLYKVVSLVENIAEPDFFDVVVSYTTGNGSIVEDKDYLVSLIDIPGGDIPTKTSDLINDGEDGVHPFITLADIIAPTLQSVTDEGNITTNSITVDSVDYYSIIKPSDIGTENKNTGNYTYLGADGVVGIRTERFDGLIKTTNLTEEITLEFPERPTGIYTIATIEDLSDYVPYEGATQDVDLGVYDITAAHLIKDGGVNTQFLKADGSVDNNVYLTSSDLPSTLDLYATTTASDIPGYTVLVRNISDLRFNTTAVDVSTGPITTLGQLVGELVSDANIISGNPGIFNITTIGNISRTSGTGQAEFYFRVYKRTSAGVETFITESSKTLPVTNGGYSEFSAVALWNDGVFLDTDRVVLKYYADRLTSPVGSNPTYNFQFGGISPVRSTAAVPVAVIPNIYLRDLADVENADALNNEVLYWNDADSLWEHSSVIDLLSPASSTVNGYLTSTDWTAFNGKFTLPALTSGSVLFSNGTTIAQKNSSFFWDNTNNRLGIGTTAPTAKLHIAAPGALSTDIALRVRNSADTGDLLSVAGNGNVTSLNGFTIGSTLSAAGIFPSGVFGKETINIRSSLIPSDTGSDIILSNGQGNVANLSSARNLVNISNGFNPTSGNGVYNLVQVAGTINQTGGASGVTRGLFINPTLTAAANFRAIETTVGNVVLNSTSGSTLIGTTTDIASSKLTVQSTTQGFLPPRMTNAQRLAIATPAIGLMVYCTDTIEGLYINKSTGWTFII